MLKVTNLGKSYNDNVVFEGINYEFKDKGFYTILGESGSGKSTFLNLISLIEKESSGSIIFNNRKINEFKEKQRRDFRINNIGFIFQSFNLFNNDTVYNNVFLAFNSSIKISKSKKEQRIDELLFRLGIGELKDSLVQNISGGEKQRVAIARALINNPSIILADEPSGSLDEQNGKAIFNYLADLSIDHLVIVVTHNKDLAYKYSDYILKLHNDNVEETVLKRNKDRKRRLLLKKEKQKQKSPKLNLGFIFNHLKNLFKFKKGRMAATLTFLSFSLLISGLTFYLKDGLTNMILSSFESLSGENSLLLKRKEDDSAILSSYSASIDDVVNIMINNPTEVDYVGCSYLNNLEEFFIEDNSVCLLDKFDKPIIIDDYSATHFNEFRYIPTFNSIPSIYPRINNKISQNDIVISLNNDKLKKICDALGIEQTYKALGDYIEQYEPGVLLKVRNDFWTYQDEILFNLRGVVPLQENVIYSNDYLFNEYVFENQLMFPSSNNLDKNEEYPWVLKKVYYFHTIDFPSHLINKLIKESAYRNFIFDGDKKIYHSSLKDGEYSNRVYCYQSLKRSIDLSFVENFAKTYNFHDYYYSTDGGYVNFGSILNGFYRPTFFSFSLEKINEIIDLNDSLKYEDYYSLAVPKGVAEGNYLKQETNTVRFNPKMSNEINGNYPTLYNEIAISKGMAKILETEDAINKNLYVTTISEIKTDEEGNLRPEFKTISLKVSGIVDDNNCEIYQEGDFTLSLFRDLFSISGFELNINSVTFILNEALLDSEIEALNSKLEDYEIIMPLKEINDSLNETMNYVFLFLIIFSSLSLVSSLILFSLLNYISFLEMKKDVAILMTIGFSNNEILKYFLLSNLFSGLIALLSATASLFIVSISTQLLSNKIFGVASSFYFSPISIVVMFLFLAIISALSLIVLLRPLQKVDLKKELH